MEITQYRDRNHAGSELAKLLAEYKDKEKTIVLGLPRGGVPVAHKIATELNLPLDIFLVRKLGVPGHEELAFGAIADGGETVINHEIIEQLNISDEIINSVIYHQITVLNERSHLYRKNRESLSIFGNIIILVDDGLATGSTMEAAIKALRLQRPEKIVVAVPVSAPDSLNRIALLADQTICPLVPHLFYSVGLWYENFGQTSDDEVVNLLEGSNNQNRSDLSGKRI